MNCTTHFTGIEPWDAVVDFENGKKYFEGPFALAIWVEADPEYPFDPVRVPEADDMVMCRIRFLLHHPNNKIGKNRVNSLTVSSLRFIAFGVNLNDDRDRRCVAKEFTLQANDILHRSEARNPVNFVKRFQKISLEKWRWCQHYRYESTPCCHRHAQQRTSFYNE